MIAAAIFIGALVVVGLQIGTGTTKRDRAGTPVTAAAPTEVVDEAFRFRLAAPDRTWWVYDRGETDREWFGSYAAMDDGVSTVEVEIERVGPVTQAQGVAQVVAWTEPPPGGQRAMTWLGRDVTELRYESHTHLRRERVFVRDGWLLRVVISRLAQRGEASAEAYERMFAAFSLLDGAITPVPGPDPAPDPRGVDWRIDGRRWESTAAALAVEPPPSWRMVAGRPLFRFRRDVDVFFIDDTIGCRLTIATSMQPLEIRTDDHTMEAEVAGEPRRFVEISGPDELLQRWATTLETGGGFVQIEGWCPRADAETSLPALRALLATITALAEPERAALAQALAAHRFDPAEIGADWVLRQGTFVHYGAGLVWRAPAGAPWQVTPGPRAAETFEDAILVAAIPGVSMAVVPDPLVSEQTVRRWVDEKLAAPVTALDLGGANPQLGPGLEVSWSERKRETFVHRIAPLVGDRKFRVHVYGDARRVRGHEAELRALLAGLDVRGVASPRERAGRFEDVRAGYAMALSGWTRTDHLVEADYIDRSWVPRDQSSLIGVMVSVGRRHHRADHAIARRRASAAVEAGRRAPVTESEDQVDGVPATRLDWREASTHVTVFLVERNDLLYTLYVRGDRRAAETARRAFRFVDAPD